MKLIAILIAKILIFIGSILKRGSTLPGKVALKIDKNILKKLKYPAHKIVVTGSSGKGSTTKIIASTLINTHHSVCYNKTGANIDRGIATILLKNSTIFGKIKTEYLVLEIDERYAKKILPYIKPDYLVITNLTKDQPPRQHYIDLVYNDVLKSITNHTKIVTNMDDPYLRKFALDTKNEFIYYSLAKNKYSYSKQIFENLTIYRCPKCQAPLKYNYYNFETLGSYYCSKCDFTYQAPNVIATSLDLTNQTFKINNQELNIGGSLLYHAYNTLSAYTCLQELLNPQDIIPNINKINAKENFGFTAYNKNFYALSCKAENASTYNQAIFKVINDETKKDIIIGWLEISRRYNHFDISWLYDIEFELLNNANVHKIYACGIDAQNIARRLILGGIPENKIVMAENIAQIKDQIIKSPVKNIYGILNFDYVKPFNETLKEEEKNDN